jgi:16S rRNA (cytosine967-C5)-methyltransferase
MYECHVTAHDVAPERMKDLPARAVRAGVEIGTARAQELAGLGLFDLVFCDAPCSGSGTWRRSLDAKWRLTETGLASYAKTQSEVISAAAALVAPGGTLAYATCSVLAAENDLIIDGFQSSQPGWEITDRKQWIPTAGWDGFFLCTMVRQ